MTRTHSILGFAGWLVLCFAAAAIGSLFPIGPWYESLVKPAWNPPNWLFGPVWTLLYILMAVAAWLVWRSHGFKGATLPLTMFAVQLALNTGWSWLFFGLHQPGVAFAEIILLWAAILATIVLFWRVKRLAGVLLLPYLLWVSFAAVLNYTVWQLNR
jgi:translocator protein